MAFARAAETRLHDANPGVGGNAVQNQSNLQQNSIVIEDSDDDARCRSSKCTTSKERLRVHAKDSTEIASH